MIVPFTKFKSNTPLFPYFLRPMLNIKLINGSNIRIQKALIDTGADYILINSSVAKDIGIDYKTGFFWSTTGIENSPVPTFFHDMEFEIPGIEKSKFRTRVGFINSPSVGILLGQHGFFDNFIVEFNRYENVFSIEKNQKNTD